MRHLFIFLIASAAIAATRPPTVDAPRTVTVGERSVVDIYVSPFYDTMIVLPAEEKIREAFAGDSGNWKVEAGKEPGRYLSVKVMTEEAAQTTLNLISDHDKPYTFHLIKSDVHCDTKVFINPDSQLSAALSKPPAFVPAAEGERIKAEAEKVRAAAAEEIKDAKQKSDSEAESYRASYPRKLNFNYHWSNDAAARKMGIEQIWNDGKFTYIRINTQEAPAIYETKDGKPSLVRAPLDKGLYTIERVLDAGYLARGKKERVSFDRQREAD